jgi:hypothetical protein
LSFWNKENKSFFCEFLDIIRKARKTGLYRYALGFPQRNKFNIKNLFFFFIFFLKMENVFVKGLTLGTPFDSDFCVA